MKGDTLGKIVPKKSLAVPKRNWKRRPSGLARYGMLRGKTGKPFWFRSLGQMVQFGAIIFYLELLGTVLVSSCGLKKKRKTTIIVAFHFMKRRLKIGEVNLSHFVSSENCHEITVLLVAGKSGNLPVYILRELICISSDLIKLISSPMPLLVSLSQSFVPSE